MSGCAKLHSRRRVLLAAITTIRGLSLVTLVTAVMQPLASDRDVFKSGRHEQQGPDQLRAGFVDNASRIIDLVLGYGRKLVVDREVAPVLANWLSLACEAHSTPINILRVPESTRMRGRGFPGNEQRAPIEAGNPHHTKQATARCRTDLKPQSALARYRKPAAHAHNCDGLGVSHHAHGPN